VQTPYDPFVAARRANFSMDRGACTGLPSIGGQYCENCHVGKIVPDDVTITAVSEGVRNALEPKNAEALWKKNEEMVGKCC
jgi:5-methylcytosine-specific restriction endonuclease McrA